MNLTPQNAVSHLEPQVWKRVNRRLIGKAISEFAHELLIDPELLQQRPNGPDRYRLTNDDGTVEYRFNARKRALDHWSIDPDSIEKHSGSERGTVDALQFLLDFRESLDVDPDLLPTYLEEISSTLYGNAYKLAQEGPDAEALTQANFQTVESAMIEGHPTFVANNGRIGFDANDYRSYAPETGADVQLIWLAAHRSRAHFTTVPDTSQRDFLKQQLGPDVIEGFHGKLRKRDLVPEDYLFLPVHPWQWYNKLSHLFSPEIAKNKLVCLGYGADDYRAQQSIRTFFNTDQPENHYVKTACSIRNMGFIRGLSPGYMETTPAINRWIREVIQNDEYLQETGFSMLSEAASIGYRYPHLEEGAPQHSGYRKMLSALWRESPVPQIEDHQRLMTMASLLHKDHRGDALLPALINHSSADPDEWLRAYLRSYLPPLLHCFFKYDLVFMPHGENLIMVLEDNVPVRMIMKDIGEEAAVMNTNVDLPEKVKRLAVDVPEELKPLSILSDIFDGFFRYVSEILAEQDTCTEENFWRLVAECVNEYQEKYPELNDKFERYDLFVPEFRRTCLNRLQLNNNKQMMDLDDPAKTLQFEGTLENPIARYGSERNAPESQIRNKEHTASRKT